jgi:hypothetical protein
MINLMIVIYAQKSVFYSDERIKSIFHEKCPLKEVGFWADRTKV